MPALSCVSRRSARPWNESDGPATPPWPGNSGMRARCLLVDKDVENCGKPGTGSSETAQKMLNPALTEDMDAPPAFFAFGYRVLAVRSTIRAFGRRRIRRRRSRVNRPEFERARYAVAGPQVSLSR